MRPFYPGGDFEAVDYGPNDVVVDNPPFSIITRIVRWYTERGVRFFLFAPYLTLFFPGRFCTSIVCGTEIIYGNGAKVNTSFVSNMFGDVAAMTAPDLTETLNNIQAVGKANLPKYKYPNNVVRATDLGMLSNRGIQLTIPKAEARFIKKLDSQGQNGVFGGGYLLSDGAAADGAAADRAAQVEYIEWALSERERRIIDEELNHGV